MSVAVYVSATVQRAPELKTARASGKQFAVCSLRVSNGSEIEFWNALIFAEAGQTEIMRLVAGDKVCLQGSLRLEIFIAKNGEHKIGRTILADNVVGLRPKPRARQTKRDSAPAREPDMIEAGEPWGGQR